MKILQIRHGETLYVFAGVKGDEAQIKDWQASIIARLKPNGHGMTLPDGSTIWIIDEVIHPLIWDKSGNRVQHNRVKCTRRGDKVTKEFIKVVWASC